MRSAAVLLLLALTGCSAELAAGEGRSGRVVRIVDGDTIHVRVGDAREKVRFIGVDTPESVHPREPVGCFAKAATAFTRRALEGRRVRLTLDVERRDRYGRLLAYVRRDDGWFHNLELVRRGYAQVLTVPPNVAHERRFLRAQREARAAQRGLWRACR